MQQCTAYFITTLLQQFIRLMPILTQHQHEFHRYIGINLKLFDSHRYSHPSIANTFVEQIPILILTNYCTTFPHYCTTLFITAPGSNGMSVLEREGLVMGINPISGKFTWTLNPKDLSMNYILHAVKTKKM